KPDLRAGRVRLRLILKGRRLERKGRGPVQATVAGAGPVQFAGAKRPPEPAAKVAMHARQAVIVEPYQGAVREVELPPPGPNQVLVATEASAVSAGTELAVWTGTHQWLRDPNLPEWKFPFRPGYSAAGTVVAVGPGVSGWAPGDRVS